MQLRIVHTTGFEYATGYENDKKTPFLSHNQCENCHGPGSGHMAAPNNPQLLAAMMPWRTNQIVTPCKDDLEVA